MVFFLRGFPAPQMSLLFVDLQNFLHLLVERRIYMTERLCHIFMYCAFTDSEFSRNRSDRCFVFHQIIGQNDAPFLIGR